MKFANAPKLQKVRSDKAGEKTRSWNRWIDGCEPNDIIRNAGHQSMQLYKMRERTASREGSSKSIRKD